MKNGINRDLDLAAIKREITGRGQNPFRKGSFHNDVSGRRPLQPNDKLARKIMDGGLSSLEDFNVPDLKTVVQECCNELVNKNTED